jgi:hypothetical protein
MKMSYEKWMSDTAAFGRVRSKELKEIDAALLAYRQAEKNSNGSILAEKQRVQKALEAWKKSKGDWKNSIRNKNKAVELLSNELGAMIGFAGGMNSRGELMVTGDEARAMKIVADAIRGNTRLMFQGKKLTVKGSKAAADINDVRSALMDFKSKGTTIVNTARGVAAPPPKLLGDQVRDLLVQLFGGDAQAAQEALGPTFMDFLNAATPFLGAISSGIKAVGKWKDLAKNLYQQAQMSQASNSFAPGDPAAAFDAILRIMDRQATEYGVAASIYTVSSASKFATTAFDAGALSGPLLGAAESLAITIQKIYLFARDWKEMKAANAILATGPYDLTLFKTYPLLGCYLIANSDTSAIINMAVGDYGRAGWKLEVEIMVKKAQPVFAKAREVISGSRFEIASMAQMKGQVIDRTTTTGRIEGAVKDISDKVKQKVGLAAG